MARYRFCWFYFAADGLWETLDFRRPEGLDFCVSMYEAAVAILREGFVDYDQLEILGSGQKTGFNERTGRRIIKAGCYDFVHCSCPQRRAVARQMPG
ncbi:hypothetical protein SBV1_1060018 [Verrucomicrobia bacterium]|nr:hypothetical protein SBV1_1060018 [Verrucomicrobiota bacterium]